MKKLNRKGFTLVELLAVIIILAIVVGITIPAVLTTTSKAKTKAFQTAADTAADWFDRQYQVAKTGLDTGGTDSVATLDTYFKTYCGSTGTTCETQQIFTSANHAALFSAAGLKTSNVSEMKVTINSSTGRSCVILTADPNGDYKGAGTVSGNTEQEEGGNC